MKMKTTNNLISKLFNPPATSSTRAIFCRHILCRHLSMVSSPRGWVLCSPLAFPLAGPFSLPDHRAVVHLKKKKLQMPGAAPGRVREASWVKIF